MTLSRSKRLTANVEHERDDAPPDKPWPYHCARCHKPYRSDGRGGWKPPFGYCDSLKRSGLDRGKGPAPVSDRKGEKRPDLGTPLQDYVERLPCLLTDHPRHACRGDVVAHHVRHKNHAGDWTERGGEKVGNLVPLCAIGGHQTGPESVHVLGRETFEDRFDVDLAAEARTVGQAYMGS